MGIERYLVDRYEEKDTICDQKNHDFIVPMYDPDPSGKEKYNII